MKMILRTQEIVNAYVLPWQLQFRFDYAFSSYYSVYIARIYIL